MTGKIYSESNNIYQDEAKILFNYYKNAAEQIVAQEERIEKEIAKLEEANAQLQKQISGLWVWFLTIILFFVYFIKRSKLRKKMENNNIRIAEFKKQHDEIFRDYKVEKMGVAYVPVASQIKYNDKSFIVDYTGQVPDSDVALQMSRQNDLLIDTINRLEEITKEAPVVESSEDAEKIDTADYSTSMQEIHQNDYVGKMDRALKTISYCMDDMDITHVSLPLVTDKSEYLRFLNEYATSDVPENAPIMPIFNADKFTNSIEKFRELNRLKDSLSTKTQQIEDVMKGLMRTIANSVQVVSNMKVASTDKIVMESNQLLFQLLKAPYNHYSPILEHEEIERIRQEEFDYAADVQEYKPFQLRASSRMRYNLLTGMWTAEDGSTTMQPFGVHQIYEEIVAPVVQNLMEENRIERLKIYNHIKDQKISYLNKWHQDTDEFYRANRAEAADLINLMQESLREYVAAYNTLISLKRTEENMKASNGSLDSTVVNTVDNSQESLAAFELQSQQFRKTQDDFEEYIERLKEDIDEKAARFGHVEYYDAKLRDGHSHENAVAGSEISELDDRRRPLASVNPLLAKSSELLPEPQVEPITFEHMALNLPLIAQNALEDIESIAQDEEDEEVETTEIAEQEDADNEDFNDDVNEEDWEYIEDEGENEDEGEDEDEDENENEDEDEGEDDDTPLTAEDFEGFTDDDIKKLIVDHELDYDIDNYDREEAIQYIINSYQEMLDEEANEETED